MRTKTRISKQVLAQMPKAVAERVSEWKERYRKAFFYSEDRPSIYLREDARYNVFFGNASSAGRCAGEWAGHSGMMPCQEIAIPIGGIVIEAELFCGHPILTVYHNSGNKLESAS